MSDRDVAEHLLEQMNEVRARCQSRQIGLEPSFRRGPIETVELRVVEEIALDAPGIVIHLPPFLARIDIRLELAEVQRATSRLWRLHRRHDRPLRLLAAHADERLLAVACHREKGDAVDELLELPLVEVEAVDG